SKARVETILDKDYILLPLWTQNLLLSSSSKDYPGDGFKPLGEEEKKNDKDPGNEANEVLSTEELRVNQEKDANVNSTNNINTVSLTANAASIKNNVVNENIICGCVDDPYIPNLEEIFYLDEDEDVGTEAEMTNLDTNILISPIATTRIHKDHPVEQIIKDIHSAPQTRRMTKNVTNYGFEDPEFPDRVYKVEKAMYGLHQAPRAWTASDTEIEGIFISQDTYVDEILKKFGFSTVKTTSTPMETSKPLMKEENAKDVDVHLYRSTIRSLMYLTSLRPDIMFDEKIDVMAMQEVNCSCQLYLCSR
nr:hypothetical protein [Tanacetum cinerariifolium]